MPEGGVLNSFMCQTLEKHPNRLRFIPSLLERYVEVPYEGLDHRITRVGRCDLGAWKWDFPLFFNSKVYYRKTKENPISRSLLPTVMRDPMTKSFIGDLKIPQVNWI